MDLCLEIKAYYPQITDADFTPRSGTIVLRDDSDGLGPYIAAWNYPGLEHPPFGYDPHKPQSEAE